MGILIALTVGLVAWIALWAFGAKSFDAFLITIVLVITAATIRIVKPHLEKLIKP